MFGSKWKINEEKLQKLPVYDRHGDIVSRKVWMMMSDRCFLSPAIMEFVSFVEQYYQVNQVTEQN